MSIDGVREARPARVPYNDWRRVTLPPPGEFTPRLSVSVIVPYYDAPEALASTLASLEGQTWPRDMFEVVVVDDGSPVPLERPRSTPLDLRVVRQEDRGFGLARARNTGVRAANHDVLVFLDGDMLVEAGWLAAHARWHHVVADAVTLGLRAHVAVDGVDVEAIRSRRGTLRELFAGRKVDPPWVERHMARTNDLTTTADDLFRVVVGANLGIGRKFYESLGGFDESFTEWGMEDTEFGYRAYTHGGLLVPVRNAFAWHQGLWHEDRERKERSLELQRAKAAHLIAHRGFRADAPGCFFTVPQYVVSVQGGSLPVDRVVRCVEQVLADPVHDLVVRMELDPGHDGIPWLRRRFDPDPRVRVAPPRTALAEFPAASFHVTLPVEASFSGGIVQRLRAELGQAVVARADLPGGLAASIARAWALHRASRTGGRVADFGQAVAIPAWKLRLGSAGRSAGGNRTAPVRYRPWRAKLDRLLAEVRQVRGPRQAWSLLMWVCRAIRWRVAGRLRGAPSGRKTSTPLGVEIVALGPRSGAVFAASSRVARTTTGGHVDVVVADTAALASGVGAPAVVLSEAPPLLSVPAFDPRADNPIGWRRRVGRQVGALGPLDRLPRGCGAERVLRADDRASLGRIHHLEDVQAFHRDVVSRAGALARLAACGVVVHVADGDRRLAPYLGAELFALMTGAVGDLDADGREALGIRMRRAALREHSLTSRARQLAERVLPDPPRLPLVSVLLVTRRPELLGRALSAVRRQSYPRLELVLGLHGDGFGQVGPDAAGPSVPVTVLRVDAGLTLGSALHLATEASRGSLLSKMDDDDVYGPDHVWDLVLAQEYSQAPLVGKGSEFVYLAASDRTIRRFCEGGERYGTAIAGGALLISRAALDAAGGWRRAARHVDRALVEDVEGAGFRVYRTHASNFLLVRHGHGHTWDVDDAYFLAHAHACETGWRPELAGVGEAAPPYSMKPASSGRVREYAALASRIHERLGRIGDGNAKRIDALRETAEQLLGTAPTPLHRAVAGDLQKALTNGDRERALHMAATARRTPDLGSEKVVSRKYRYVWICIPKAASRSIKTLLCEIDPDARVIRGKSISDVYAMHPEARGYFSFAFVRDPYRRAFSFYADKYLRPDDEKRRFFVDPWYGASHAFSFDDLCRWLNTPYGSDAFADRHWLSQCSQVVLDDGRLPDFVGRYETLDAGFRTVCEGLGMPSRKLPRLNTMAGWRPTAEETRNVRHLPDANLHERNRTLLERRYARDFTLLNMLRERE